MFTKISTMIPSTPVSTHIRFADPPPMYFSFYGHGTPRDIPSFPTRRSSDLAEHHGHARALASGKLVRVYAAEFPGGKRSEEHTSELQSPDHLVCRLLLERKQRRGEPEPAPDRHQVAKGTSQAAVQRTQVGPL